MSKTSWRAMVFCAAAAVLSMVAAGAAMAGMGQPSPMQLGLQDPATIIAHEIHTLHDYINIIIIAVAAFVLILLIYVVLRFNERANPSPSKTTHNTLLEVAWTVVPVLILVAIAIPSFKLLYHEYAYPKPDLVIKATASQWFWTHEYPDQKVRFDSVMLQEDERAQVIKDGMPASQVPRLLAVDNELLVPVNKVVHVLVTANDVIHNWTVPSFGSKVDAVPGRVTATWFKADHEGIFFGQCSELCGKNHAFMPIAVRVVKEPVFNDWIAAQKARDKKKVKEIIQKVALEFEAANKKVADASGTTR
ncbi:MAG: cytochrome c oxidase subunit II [Hyphomicrobiaceae bacterium]